MTENEPNPPEGDIHEGADTPPRLSDLALDDIRVRAARAYALGEASTGRFGAYADARAHMLALCRPETVLVMANELTACRRRGVAPAG